MEEQFQLVQSKWRVSFRTATRKKERPLLLELPETMEESSMWEYFYLLKLLIFCTYLQFLHLAKRKVKLCMQNALCFRFSKHSYDTQEHRAGHPSSWVIWGEALAGERTVCYFNASNASLVLFSTPHPHQLRGSKAKELQSLPQGHTARSVHSTGGTAWNQSFLSSPTPFSNQ